MAREKLDYVFQEREPGNVYPLALFCGYSKSGTTIITKTFAHCTGYSWNNEVRELWGVSQLVDRARPLSKFLEEFKNEDRWLTAQPQISLAPILKFPEGLLLINLFPPETSVVCVVRNPLDTICAYLERQRKFKTLSFTDAELHERVNDWNYQYLAASQSRRPLNFVRYEDFLKDPSQVVGNVSRFLNLPILHDLPRWISEQAQPYFKYLPDGHQVRGLGRYKLSINSQTMQDSILAICKPAMDYLETQGVTFSEM